MTHRLWKTDGLSVKQKVRIFQTGFATGQRVKVPHISGWDRGEVMRDSDRIFRIMNLLYRYWENNPDLRLAQIVGNANNGPRGDPYHMEDDRLEDYLRRELDDTGEYAGLIRGSRDAESYKP